MNAGFGGQLLAQHPRALAEGWAGRKTGAGGGGTVGGRVRRRPAHVAGLWSLTGSRPAWEEVKFRGASG